MKLDIPGLLGAISGLPTAINRGLLGPLPVNPGMGLDPNQVRQSQDQALNDMAFGMLAGNRQRPGASLFAARQNAQEGFRGRIFDMLKEQEYMRMQSDRAKQDQDDAMVRSQIALYRQENPQDANLPDAMILKKMDPNFGLQTSKLALDQQQAAQSVINSDRSYDLQQQQLAQSKLQADRMYALQQLDAQRAEQELRLKMAAGKQGAKPTEAQGKAAVYVSRMQQAAGDVRDEAPGLKDFGLYATTLGTGGITQALANKGINDDWLKHFNATRAYLSGILRQDTGAAITAEEYRQYYPTYFPIPGDGPAEIAQKRALRENEIARVGGLAEGVVSIGTTGQGSGVDALLDKYAPLQ